MMIGVQNVVRRVVSVLHVLSVAAAPASNNDNDDVILGVDQSTLNSRSTQSLLASAASHDVVVYFTVTHGDVTSPGAILTALIHRESKKQVTKLLAITSPTIIRFSKFLH